MEKRMKQMLEADVQIQGGGAAWNNAEIKGTLDGLKKKSSQMVEVETRRAQETFV